MASHTNQESLIKTHLGSGVTDSWPCNFKGVSPPILHKSPAAELEKSVFLLQPLLS